MIPHTLSNKLTTLYTAFATLAILGCISSATANAACGERGRNSRLAIPAPLIGHPGAGGNSIAGLWHVIYTTSDNEPFQESFDMWHSDGTELESANVTPLIGNFCMGTWAQIGSQVHLHHVGWGYDDFANLVGPFSLDDLIVVSNHGNSYSGSFDFKQYDTLGNLVQEITGTLTADRIGVN